MGCLRWNWRITSARQLLTLLKKNVMLIWRPQSEASLPRNAFQFIGLLPQ